MLLSFVIATGETSVYQFSVSRMKCVG